MQFTVFQLQVKLSCRKIKAFLLFIVILATACALAVLCEHGRQKGRDVKGLPDSPPADLSPQSQALIVTSST